MKGLVKFITALIIGSTTAISGYCSQPEPDDDTVVLKSVRQKIFRGKQYVVIDGDTVVMLIFNDINVYPPLKFKNKKEESGGLLFSLKKQRNIQIAAVFTLSQIL